MCSLIGHNASSAEHEEKSVTLSLIALLELEVIHATGNICIASLFLSLFQIPNHANLVLKFPEKMNDCILVPTSRSS